MIQSAREKQYDNDDMVVFESSQPIRKIQPKTAALTGMSVKELDEHSSMINTCRSSTNKDMTRNSLMINTARNRDTRMLIKASTGCLSMRESQTKI